MKQISDRRRQRNAEVRDLRNALIAEAGQCMLCGASESKPNRRLPADMSRLAVHEILNGPLRNKTLDEPCSLLVVCWACNSGPLNRKHEWPVDRQLALLQDKSKHYDLVRFNFLRNPNAPNYVNQDEVDHYRSADS